MAKIRVSSRVENSYKFALKNGKMIIVNGTHQSRLIGVPMLTEMDSVEWEEIQERYKNVAAIRKGHIFTAKNDMELQAKIADKDVDLETGFKQTTKAKLKEIHKQLPSHSDAVEIV